MGLEIGVLRTTDEGSDRLGRLGTLLHPVIDTLEIKLEVVILQRGVIPAENLEELAVTRGTFIRRHDTICRVVLATGATHSNLDHFFCFPIRFEKTAA
jgi:hypothetical protein